MGQPLVRAGKLSIVVPIYNVEAYLEECLESIRAQGYPDIEVLLVDDGSSDRSHEIAKRFTKHDRRFHLITQENRGLGAARNTGIRHASGAFLTFVDSDDKIPADAYVLLISSLKDSNSDFAVGAVERWNGDNSWRTQWVTDLHSKTRTQVSLLDLPEVVQNIFAWNKVFRKDFFSRAVGKFPEKILYEDQVPTAQAYTASSKFDLIAQTTYFWRVRGDKSSITQNKISVKDLRDRIYVAQQVERIYKAFSDQKTYDFWLQKTIGIDFSYYYRLAPLAAEEYWETLQKFIQDFFPLLTDSVWLSVPIKLRLLAAVAESGDKEALALLVNEQHDNSDGVPSLKTKTGDMEVDFARLGLRPIKLRKGSLLLSPQDLQLKTGFTSIYWDEQKNLFLEGYLFIANRPENRSALITATLVNEDGETLTLPVEAMAFDTASRECPASSYYSYENTGIKVAICSSSLQDFSFSRARVLLTYDDNELKREIFWGPQDNYSGPYLAPVTYEGAISVELGWNPKDGLQLYKTASELWVRRLTVNGVGDGEIELVSAVDKTAAKLVISNEEKTSILETDTPPLAAGHPANVQFSLPRSKAVFKREQRWHLEYRGLNGFERLLRPVEVNELAAANNHLGQLVFEWPPLNATATKIIFEGDVVRIEGCLNAPHLEEPTIFLRRLDGYSVNAEALTLSEAGRSFSVVFRFTDTIVSDSFDTSKDTLQRFDVCLGDTAEGSEGFAKRLLWRDEYTNGIQEAGSFNGLSVEINDFGYHRTLMVVLEQHQK